ncbi:MAG: YggS family pyridoxal phosphate-dependent enzyme [Bacillota bacterium]|jgi:pyridoxal phosphate enzyme (YggS family)|nr:YggS family pyridoxal phosphate-dependent enzyme [Thermoanaerobacteraceae bacterium]
MEQVIGRNLQRVREEIARAARRAGRDPAEIKIVAVSKGVPVAAVRTAQALGLTAFGESRVQEFVRKYREIGDQVEWHFIGYLQRNKVKYLLGRVQLIHSLDRWNLAVELDRRGVKRGVVFDVLVQVNIAREPGKHGLYEEEVRDFLAAAADLAGVRVRGLMTLAPYVQDPEEARPVFRRLRELAGRCRDVPGVMMEFLSMGMTQDFAVAVEEGANLVRIGTAIFGFRE